MAVLNSEALAKARNLIKDGRFATAEGWEFTVDDSMALVESLGDDVASVHLGLDGERSVYPYAKASDDGLVVHKAALMSIEGRAVEAGEDDIAEGARSLLRLMDETEAEGGGSVEGDGSEGSEGGDGPPSGTGERPIPGDRAQREREMLAKLRDSKLERPMLAQRTINADEESRTVELSFSSDQEVETWYGIEILSHDEGAVRLERLRTKGPLVSEHWGRQIGVTEDVWIEESSRGKARVRFSRNQLAEEEWQDVLDDIRVNVSVRYLVHGVRLIEERDGVDVWLVTDWEPMHIALVAEPADLSVGVGRSLGGEGRTPRGRNDVDKDKAEREAMERELREKFEREQKERAEEYATISSEFAKVDGIDQMAARAQLEGKTPDEFRRSLLKHLYETKQRAVTEQESPEIGLTEGEAKRWSWMRAIKALVAMETGQNRNHVDEAGFEIECGKEVARKLKLDNVRGIPVPWDKLAKTRAMSTATAAAGGNLVGTELMAGSFIEQLVAADPILSRATLFPGLVGDVDFPAGTSLPTAYHIATEGDAITAESSPQTGLVPLTPRELGAYTDMTRKMLKQSAIALDSWVEGRLSLALRLKMAEMAINGSGASGQPTGILNASGVGSVSAPSPAAADSLFGMMVDLKTALRTANAEMNRLAYVTHPDVQGLLEQTEKTAGNGQYIWVEGENGGRVAGRAAYATTLCPNNLGGTTDESAIVYGNWADLYVGLWGTIDLTVDRASLSTKGGLRIVAFQDYDVALAHAASFAAVTDLDVDNDY